MSLPDTVSASPTTDRPARRRLTRTTKVCTAVILTLVVLRAGA